MKYSVFIVCITLLSIVCSYNSPGKDPECDTKYVLSIFQCGCLLEDCEMEIIINDGEYSRNFNEGILYSSDELGRDDLLDNFCTQDSVVKIYLRINEKEKILNLNVNKYNRVCLGCKHSGVPFIGFDPGIWGRAQIDDSKSKDNLL